MQADTPPAETSAALMQLAGGLWISRAIWVAAHLRIADHIDTAPVSIEDLAAATATRPDPLGRLLTALATVGVFDRDTEGRVSHTPISRLLRSDHPATQRAFIESVFGHEHYEAWGAIEGTLRTGVTAFDLHYGKPVFDWFGEHPATAALFGEAMTSVTLATEEAVIAAHDFGAFTLAVDVGGSHGSLLRRLLAQAPEARGIVFDLPSTVAEGERMWQGTPEAARLSAMGGDFFQSVPAGGDLYLLKFILHDWTDQQSIAILRNIRAAMKPDGTVAIIEMVLPDDPATRHPGRFMDLNMLVMTGGRERSAKDYAALLHEAGLTLRSVTPTASPMSVITAGMVE
ncbi:methyltransferase [Flavisphingomonas formosensis]|uniref:methyltransferase n=1 Tax=Flavisphingomonas formosensis TaxID=861534 RepID=UPI0012FBED0E|nr:methyltransferase [Sphingomonas formosensis]